MSDQLIKQTIESADDLAAMVSHALLTMRRVGHSFPDLKDALDNYQKTRSAKQLTTNRNKPNDQS